MRFIYFSMYLSVYTEYYVIFYILYFSKNVKSQAGLLQQYVLYIKHSTK